MTKNLAATAVLAGAAMLGACTPTVRVEVAPISIYAKLDADVRLRLDDDVKACLEASMNGHLAKPIDPEVMFREMRKALYSK